MNSGCMNNRPRTTVVTCCYTKGPMLSWQRSWGVVALAGSWKAWPSCWQPIGWIGQVANLCFATCQLHRARCPCLAVSSWFKMPLQTARRWRCLRFWPSTTENFSKTKLTHGVGLPHACWTIIRVIVSGFALCSPTCAIPLSIRGFAISSLTIGMSFRSSGKISWPRLTTGTTFSERRSIFSLESQLLAVKRLTCVSIGVGSPHNCC